MTRHSTFTPEIEAGIFETVIDLVREHGYEPVAMGQIADECEVSAAALQLRWGGKAQLVAEALRHRAPSSPGDLDTGGLRGDLLECTRRMTALNAEDDALMSRLAAAAQADPELTEAVQDVLAHPAAEMAHRILDHAAARGEIAADTPGREFIHELLMTIALTRRVSGRPTDERYLERFVDTVFIPMLRARR